MIKLLDRFRMYAALVFPWIIISMPAANGQNVAQQLKNAFAAFEKDPQLAHAISSLYIMETGTGTVVLEKNAFTGLAPASTQKIITSAAAFELLGRSYQYKTSFIVTPECRSLNIIPSGDPTFGSERWENTRPAAVKQKLVPFLRPFIKDFDSIRIHNAGWDPQDIPDGWMWQDIGNYYGAGAGMLNWRENQFDIMLTSGKKIGDPVKITNTSPVLYEYSLQSLATSASAGSGDNAYVYFPVNGSRKAVITGTIPVNEKSFVISGALPDGLRQFIGELNDSIKEGQLTHHDIPHAISGSMCETQRSPHTLTFYSPPLDSIIYWFNKKSINLYGEALAKTLSYQKYAYASTDSGISVIKNLWKSKGLDMLELNMVDGSGLSPLNRVTTHAQVEILQYARKQPWFLSFYQSLPEYNGMKMKSGTIRNVKGFCGYHTSKTGKEYVFSFLVNNYNGSPAALVRKMYKVLDHLK
ncbi:MAG: D-alanyl-D-alanine carboxypeptidase/D-alanyl-D-alanine-endopeptidase [Chitinophagaceae bacterium]|nr:D-alanyl-D-alanine carboxypeptidase/D-alanyl-D-alanine-endopeptidase [Chitinophagaceae bacterium]